MTGKAMVMVRFAFDQVKLITGEPPKGPRRHRRCLLPRQEPLRRRSQNRNVDH